MFSNGGRCPLVPLLDFTLSDDRAFPNWGRGCFGDGDTLGGNKFAWNGPWERLENRKGKSGGKGPFPKFVVVLCGTQATEKWLLTTSRLPVSSFPRLNVPTYSTVSVSALYSTD